MGTPPRPFKHPTAKVVFHRVRGKGGASKVLGMAFGCHRVTERYSLVELFGLLASSPLFSLSALTLRSLQRGDDGHFKKRLSTNHHQRNADGVPWQRFAVVFLGRMTTP